MNNRENSFTIEEIVSVASRRVVKEVDFFTSCEKISNSLKNSPNYEYDEQKTLAENIYAAFPKYKLEKLTEEFRNWDDEHRGEYRLLMCNDIKLRAMAERDGIPSKLWITVKEDGSKGIDKKNNARKSENATGRRCPPLLGKTMSEVLSKVKNYR